MLQAPADLTAPTAQYHHFVVVVMTRKIIFITIIIIILYTCIAHQTIKLSPMRWMRILAEQECF